MFNSQQVKKKENPSVLVTDNLVSITKVMAAKINLINGTKSQSVFGWLEKNKEHKHETLKNQIAPKKSICEQTGVSPESKSRVSVPDGSTVDADKSSTRQEDANSLNEHKFQENLNNSATSHNEISSSLYSMSSYASLEANKYKLPFGDEAVEWMLSTTTAASAKPVCATTVARINHLQSTAAGRTRNTRTREDLWSCR